MPSRGDTAGYSLLMRGNGKPRDSKVMCCAWTLRTYIGYCIGNLHSSKVPVQVFVTLLQPSTDNAKSRLGKTCHRRGLEIRTHENMMPGSVFI